MSTPLTDAELEARVAVIAGWKQIPDDASELWRHDGDGITRIGRPHYASDLNAVVPVMEKEGFWRMNFDPGLDGESYYVFVRNGNRLLGKSDTLARAICLALVAAHEGKDKL